MNQPRFDKISVGIVVLAAGASTRLGKPKQTLLVGNVSLLRCSVEMALNSSCSCLIVVLGANAGLLRKELDGLHVNVVENSSWAEGLGSSIRTGLKSLQANNAATDAVLFMLCDQPLVTSEFLDRIIETFSTSGKDIIASEYGGKFGVPALFSSSMFAEIAKLSGEEGAKSVIYRHLDQVEGLPFPGGRIDIDTAEDYQQFIDLSDSDFTKDSLA